jgi:hypothetical protein
MLTPEKISFQERIILRVKEADPIKKINQYLIDNPGMNSMKG